LAVGQANDASALKMGQAAPRPCTYPGCGALTAQGRCERHRESVRENAHARGYTRRWQNAARAFLREHPLCQCPECDEGRVRTRAATVVDHHIPHRGDRALFWDRSNWRALAKRCHDRKTAREDGGYGNQ